MQARTTDVLIGRCGSLVTVSLTPEALYLQLGGLVAGGSRSKTWSHGRTRPWCDWTPSRVRSRLRHTNRCGSLRHRCSSGDAYVTVRLRTLAVACRIDSRKAVLSASIEIRAGDPNRAGAVTSDWTCGAARQGA